MKTQEELLQQRKALADHAQELRQQLADTCSQISALNVELGYRTVPAPPPRITPLPEDILRDIPT